MLLHRKSRNNGLWCSLRRNRANPETSRCAGFARKETAVSNAIHAMPGIRGKELCITGTVDPLARRVLEKKGWKLEDKIQERLLK